MIKTNCLYHFAFKLQLLIKLLPKAFQYLTTFPTENLETGIFNIATLPLYSRFSICLNELQLVCQESLDIKSILSTRSAYCIQYLILNLPNANNFRHRVSANPQRTLVTWNPTYL